MVCLPTRPQCASETIYFEDESGSDGGYLSSRTFFLLQFCHTPQTIGTYELHHGRFIYFVTRALQPRRRLRAIGAILQSGPTKQRAPTMVAHIVSDGRLFGLKPFDWVMLLAGMTLCGALTSLF